jgi:hypothetical protein
MANLLKMWIKFSISRCRENIPGLVCAISTNFLRTTDAGSRPEWTEKYFTRTFPAKFSVLQAVAAGT